MQANLDLDRYGAAAAAHMRAHRPDRYHQIENPESYFLELGDQMAAQISEVEQALLAAETPESDYTRRAGQLTSARRRAEEVVLADLVYPADPKETETATDPAAPSHHQTVWADPGWEDWQDELWHRGLNPETGRPLLTDPEIENLATAGRETATK